MKKTTCSKTVGSKEKNDDAVSGTNRITFSSARGVWVIEEIKIEAEKMHDSGFGCKIRYPGFCRNEIFVSILLLRRRSQICNIPDRESGFGHRNRRAENLLTAGYLCIRPVISLPHLIFAQNHPIATTIRCRSYPEL